MQVFLPYPDFAKSLACLDNKRLGKQRVEAYQIIKLLQDYNENKPWAHHPAVLMFKTFEDSLILYYNLSLLEFQNRGFNNIKLKSMSCSDKPKYPDWFSDSRLFSSHRSNLLRKNKEHYSKFGWSEPDNLPYYWPILCKNY